MRSLIASELLKIRTTRAAFVGTLVVVAWALLGPVLVAIAPAGASVPTLEPASLAELVRGPARLTDGAALLIGLLAATAEFAHGTVLTTRLAEPRSTRVLTAKLAALSLVGLAVGVMVVSVSLVSGGILLASKGIAVQPLDHGVPRTVATVLVLMVLHSALGVAVGSLVRNTAAAVGGVMLWVFVVEGFLPPVTNRPGIAHWLPGGAVSEVLAERTPAGQLLPAAAAALLLGYAALVVTASIIVDRVREL
jgi:ABC-2 type transport system permease protein